MKAFPSRRTITVARSILSSLLLIVFVISLPNAFGQLVQTPTTEEQRRRAQVNEEERQRLVQEPKVDLRSEDQFDIVDTHGLPPETPCFAIQHITLATSPHLSDSNKQQGASALQMDPFFFAQQYLNRYSNQCVGQEGLNIIIKRLTSLILQKGYSTTRVGLPEQELASGHLTITLVPGIIHEIRFADPLLDGTWRNAFPIDTGKLLNLRDLEQGLEQMKRVPYQDVDMQIVPADKVGESNVILSVQRHDAVKLSASLDNGGAKGTGQYQGGVNLSVDNLFGISDMFNIGVNSDANREGNQRGTAGQNLYYAVPFGFWYYSLSASNSDYHQEIAGTGQHIVSSGKSKNLDIKTSYLFQRDQYQKNSLNVNFGKQWAHAFIDNTEIDVQKRDVTYVEFGWTHKHYFDQNQLDLTIAQRCGTSWFGGQSDAPDRTSDYLLQKALTTITWHLTINPK